MALGRDIMSSDWMLIDGDVKKGSIAKDTAASTFTRRMQSE